MATSTRSITGKWALTLCLGACACEVYGPELVTFPAQGGSGGVSGGGQGAASVGASAGMVAGGLAGDAGSAMAGEGGQPPEPEPETVPYLTVSIGSPSIAVGLTADGALDWVHWGLEAATDRNQKAGVTSLLQDFKPTGSKQPTPFLDGPIAFNWSDGTPTASATSNDGIAWLGVGEGFELTVPAVLEVRKLKLYVGVSNGTGAMKASLSDPRANSIGDDRFSSQTADWSIQLITIDYGNATLPDTTMNVSWVLETAGGAGAAVALCALSIGHG